MTEPKKTRKPSESTRKAQLFRKYATAQAKRRAAYARVTAANDAAQKALELEMAARDELLKMLAESGRATVDGASWHLVD